MEITVKTKDLLQELTLAVLVADKKSTLPVLSCVLMEAHKPALPGEEGRLSLVASDLDQFIQLSLPAEVKKPGKTVIHLKKLADYTRLVESDDMSLKTTDSWATISAGKSKTRMALLSAESFPAAHPEPGTPWLLPARAFAAAIERTIFAVESTSTKFTLNGCLMEFSQEGLRVVSTDGHRMCVADVACKQGLANKRVLLSRNAMATVAKLAEFAQLGEEFKFSLDSKHETTLVFELGTRTLFSRALTGNFPDYERVLPRGHSGSAVVSRQAFARGLSRARLFTDARSSAVWLEIGDQLELSAATADLGESAEQICLKQAGSAVLRRTGFNSQYLLDFFNAAGTDYVELSFKDPNSAMVLRPWVEGEEAAQSRRYDCVVMPMRI